MNCICNKGRCSWCNELAGRNTLLRPAMDRLGKLNYNCTYPSGISNNLAVLSTNLMLLKVASPN